MRPQKKPTDLEDEAAKCLHQLEMNNPNLKQHMQNVFINSAELVEYQQQDGSLSKCLLVKIPYRSAADYQKVSEKVIEELEKKFNWPVIVIANRTIISKHGKSAPPRGLSRLLISVLV